MVGAALPRKFNYQQLRSRKRNLSFQSQPQHCNAVFKRIGVGELRKFQVDSVSVLMAGTPGKQTVPRSEVWAANLAFAAAEENVVETAL